MTKDDAISLLQRHERARQGRLRAKVNDDDQELDDWKGDGEKIHNTVEAA